MTLVAPRVSPRGAQKRKTEQQAMHGAHLPSKKHYQEEKRRFEKVVPPTLNRDAQVDVQREAGFVRVTILLPEVAPPAGRIASKMPLPGSLTLKKSVVRVVNVLWNDDKPLTLTQMAERLKAATTSEDKSAAIRTKSAQSTIGVTSSKELHAQIARQAQALGIAFAEQARKAFERGFQSLEERLWEESSVVVSRDFESSYGKYSSADTTQWSLRVPRNIYVRAVVIAKERGISQSALACWCLSYGNA